MPHDYLSPALPLTGAEALIVSQKDPATGKFRPRRVTVSDLLTLLGENQSEADAGQDAALASAEKAITALADRLGDAEGALHHQAAALDAQQARLAAAEVRLSAREATDTDQGARIAALEGRPEEAAHFTALAKLPAITALQPVTLTLASLVPARAGDVLRKGEPVTVTPAAALPAGVNIAAAFVPADGTVAVQLTTGISIALGTVPIAWSITVHR